MTLHADELASAAASRQQPDADEPCVLARLSATLPHTDQLPPVHDGLLRALRPIAQGLLRVPYRVRSHHMHNIPEGPAIIAPNHVATIDGPLIVIETPDSFAMAKNELFESAAAPILRAAGQISLARSFPDAGALRRAVQVLRAGHRLAIFPESRRGAGDFHEFHGGVAWLALVTGAPVVPVAILGTKPASGNVKAHPSFGAHIDVVYGGAQRVAQQGWPRRRDDVAAVRERLQRACQEHLSFAQELVGRRLDPQLRCG